MSYCLNSECRKPYNPSENRFCQSCGAKLLLGDRYRAIKPIGQGGFGKTFLAVDEHKPSLPRCVIKQFFPQNSANAQKAAELFRREAIRLDELGQHPQIPELMAHFQQGEQQYLVQEFIDGQNLEQELFANGTFTENQIQELLWDLLPVLEFVHERLVIHRDIKPENIIRRNSITLPDGGGEIKGQLVLVDFGASKVITESSLGKTGTSIGSAGYVAPEQLAGRAVPASDLYNLGVTCIYLLTQVAPFELFDVVEGKWVWRQYLQSNISEDLGIIIDRLLVPNISERYQSVGEVLKELESVKYQKSFAASASQTGNNNPSLLTKMLGGIPQVIKGRIMQEFGKTEEAIASYDRAIAIRPNNYDAWYKKAEVCYQLKRYEEAIFCYEKTVKLQPNHWQGWLSLGVLFYQFNRYEKSVESYFKSLDIQPEQPMVWLWLSLAIRKSGDEQKAQMCLEKARQCLPKSPVETAEILWRAWEKLVR
ncbi:MAG: tetratricopeptide repeat protein [Okeania sp. SIO2F4]|uniref:serine/threonine-protein kinase n=1 Tax=Okeania sp. SIO2F4 TaxID=2607790 RepID=UPI00142B92A1|nr:serine/threonine-protein kinase [Okeania sp. SIO2F4]NES06087.1 tetratricopeptide repeat protein [Okeania sp. SIO2F4]